jgi:hypothetical protein
MNMTDYPLRQKKHAQTKIAIMNVFLQRLNNSHYSDISIREVCRSVEIAEGTFFNYFPEKIDVIHYYLHLSTIKMIWRAQQETPQGKYLPIIDAIFTYLTEEFHNNNVMYQIISVLLDQTRLPEKVDITDLEKILAFPDCPGIEKTKTMILDKWLKEYVVKAQKNGELHPQTKVDEVVISLMTIITGTLMATRFHSDNIRGYHYMRQLQDLWKVLGVSETK